MPSGTRDLNIHKKRTHGLLVHARRIVPSGMGPGPPVGISTILRGLSPPLGADPPFETQRTILESEVSQLHIEDRDDAHTAAWKSAAYSHFFVN
ncbi:hypothetical protein An09g02350 [Aspergillus niger]|uniref:Uncharacterized protein n=2 Tax=Aspergillus niger TaxID=5061 RepID=A2QTJ7_ASPNC|nr:hypothetical protein An09g02350 [Aspergillus niger]CAK40172.1 hypothetical protein An09g02350 [Aspergillus niger]